MRVSAAGLAFIKQREGFFPVVYDDGVGVATIGYGTTTADVSPLPLHLTEREASRLLAQRLDTKYEPVVRALFAEGGPLHAHFNQHRYDALVSFAYNLGAGSMPHRVGGRWRASAGFETLGGAILSGRTSVAAASLHLYSDPGTSVHAGLLARREAEASMFLRPMGRFEMFTAGERDLVLEVERLKGHTSAAARAKVAALRRRALVQAGKIKAVVERGGDWRDLRRRTRYDAMVALA